MLPKKRRADANPHTNRQQDDMIMECFKKFSPIGGAAEKVMGKKKQLVWEPLHVTVMQQLPQVNALILESTPDAKLRVVYTTDDLQGKWRDWKKTKGHVALPG
jgi:hypothetical protein